MPSRYTFTDHDPGWAAAYRREATRLAALLEGVLVSIHHIGSTSVPGLAAKPIIDVLPLVTAIETVDDCTPRLEAAGYHAWGEFGLPGRRYFSKDDDAGWRTHNVHIYAHDDPDVTRHLAFPAYLRTHPDIAREYEQVKRRAYELHPSDVAAYNDAKDGWIKDHEQRALRWWRTMRPPQNGV
jgi:GrpB-like predicted nucleotidyltransferase (UPF0157 family)